MADDPPQCCGSCGDETEDLVHVRRLYILTTPRDELDVGVEGVTPEMTEGDLEWWCEVCRIHYPHRTA